MRLCARMEECVALGLNDTQQIQLGVIPYAVRGKLLCRRCLRWLRAKHETRASRKRQEQAGIDPYT